MSGSWAWRGRLLAEQSTWFALGYGLGQGLEKWPGGPVASGVGAVVFGFALWIRIKYLKARLDG